MLSPSSNTDQFQLIASLKKGDGKAFDRIYDSLANRLYLYVLKKIGNKEISEEIVQEVFIVLWDNRNSIEVDSSLDAYLYGVARNKVFSFMRSEHVRKKYTTEFSLFAQRSRDNSIEEAMDVKDLQKILQDRISELPPKCQTAFKLSRFENEPISQIAERMNISTGSVENYITQALRHLRTRMTSLFFVLLIMVF